MAVTRAGSGGVPRGRLAGRDGPRAGAFRRAVPDADAPLALRPWDPGRRAALDRARGAEARFPGLERGRLPPLARVFGVCFFRERGDLRAMTREANQGLGGAQDPRGAV